MSHEPNIARRSATQVEGHRLAVHDISRDRPRQSRRRIGALVPFAKAYSGLTDAEIAEVDAFIRRNTLERFGPVRTVKPELVFERIPPSARHKSGIAVRCPRMLRMRPDKPAAEADTLDNAKALAGL